MAQASAASEGDPASGQAPVGLGKWNWWQKLIAVVAVLLNVALVGLGFSLAFYIAQKRANSAGDLAQEGQVLFSAVSLVVASALAWTSFYYARVTRRILASQQEMTKATRAQAAVAARQLGVAHAQLADARAQVELEEAARVAAQRHAERVLEESVRARLDAATPVVSVSLSVAGWGDATGQAAGDMTMQDFVGRQLRLALHYQFTNHGPGPALVCAESPAVGELAAGVTTAEVLVADGQTAMGRWEMIASGSTWLKWDSGTPEFRFRSRSPLSSARDEHSWRGTFVVPQSGDSVLCNQIPNLIGPDAADQVRTFPEVLN